MREYFSAEAFIKPGTLEEGHTARSFAISHPFADRDILSHHTYVCKDVLSPHVDMKHHQTSDLFAGGNFKDLGSHRMLGPHYSPSTKELFATDWRDPADAFGGQATTSTIEAAVKEENKTEPQTDMQESEGEHKIESGDEELEDRLYGAEIQAAEHKMSEWLKEPKLMGKWVAVRDGEPVLPSDSFSQLVQRYSDGHREAPRYVIKISHNEWEDAKAFRERNQRVALDAESAERKMEQWLVQYPELRLKWVAVRDGEPVCPADDVHEVAEKYRKKYGEDPRYRVQIGTHEELVSEADIPILRDLE